MTHCSCATFLSFCRRPCLPTAGQAWASAGNCQIARGPTALSSSCADALAVSFGAAFSAPDTHRHFLSIHNLLALTANSPGEPGRPGDPGANGHGSPGSLRNPLSRALLLLTFSTGLVDAASYLGLGHVFAANMTGNVVLLGFGIAHAGGLPVVAPIVSLGAFLLGAGASGRLAVRPVSSPQHRLAAAAIVEGGMLLGATVLSAVVHVRAGAFSGDAVIALLAMGMGARNAVVRALRVPDLTTTVLTMTLTALAAESPPFGGSGRGTARRLSAVGAMLAGALTGALLLKTSLTLVLGVATVLAVVTLSACWRSASEEAAS
jgi:uncharacterized membrane protein YoaK (UPF0700 family)